MQAIPITEQYPHLADVEALSLEAFPQAEYLSPARMIAMQNGRLSAVLSSNEDIPADCLILCIGHSARDTYEKLYAQQVFLEQKEFAVGTRAEHPQILIDKNQYGRFCGHPRLEPAEYHLTHTAANGRGVYTFCMDWLYIEVNAGDLMTELEAGVNNLSNCCDAILDCMLEGDGFIVEPKEKNKKSASLTVRYYCDNLSEDRKKYFAK